MDASFFDEVDYALVALFVFLTDVLHQVEQQLSPQNLVPMHPCNVTKLRLTCRGQQSSFTIQTPTNNQLGQSGVSVSCFI